MVNGKLGQSLMNFGQNLMMMTAGLAALRRSNCCHGSYGMGAMMGMNTSIWGSGCFGGRMGSYMGGYSGMPGMSGMDGMSRMMTQMSFEDAKANGYASFMQLYNELSSKSNSSIKKAKAVDTEKQSKALAQSFDEKAGNITKESSGSIQISDFASKDAKEAAKQYKKDFTDLGKSYVANMDSNKDGYISKEEYIKANDNGEKTQAANQFEAIDLNNDGVIDYQEMTSAFYAMDKEKADDGKTLDGSISHDRFRKFNENIAGVGDDTAAVQKNIKAEVDVMTEGWKKLFGSEEKES